MIDALSVVARAKFGDDKFVIDGVMLLKGIGVEANEQAGKEWIAKAKAAREASAAAAAAERA